MDLYMNVSGDVDAMRQFDNILGGLGQDTISSTIKRVEANSKHDKIERVIEGTSEYFKSDYELFVEHHKMLMEDYAATQIHLKSILDKKNDVKSIAKLSQLCEQHQCSNIGELFVEKQDNEHVRQTFLEFQKDMENNLNLKKSFNQFADSFEGYRYNLENCNKLSGLDKPFSLEGPNEKQLNFIANSSLGVKQTLLDYQNKLQEQQITVDKFKNDASYTALFPLATNDKNLFTNAAIEIYVVQSPRYQDYLRVIKSELKTAQEYGGNIFDQHFKQSLIKPEEIKQNEKSRTMILSNDF